jgi:hypothetical protein
MGGVNLKRRGFIAGFASLLASPAVVRAETIMRVVSISPIADRIERAIHAGKSNWDGDGFLLPERTITLDGLAWRTISGLSLYVEHSDGALLIKDTCHDLTLNAWTIICSPNILDGGPMVIYP